MTYQIETSEDLDTLILDNKARFTLEEAIARRDARNALFDVGDL